MDNENASQEPRFQDQPPETRRKQVLSTIIVTMLMLPLLAVVLLMVYWINQDTDVLLIKNDPVPSVRTVTRPNEVIIFKVDYCKYTDSPGIIERYIVTQYREIKLPEQQDNTKRTCIEQQDLPVVMPDGLRPSPAHIRWRITYKLNPLRTVVEEFSSQPFQIEEGASSDKMGD